MKVTRPSFGDWVWLLARCLLIPAASVYFGWLLGRTETPVYPGGPLEPISSRVVLHSVGVVGWPAPGDGERYNPFLEPWYFLERPGSDWRGANLSWGGYPLPMHADECPGGAEEIYLPHAIGPINHRVFCK